MLPPAPSPSGWGLEEGTQPPRSIIEFYYKNDQLGDPMNGVRYITAFGWAAPPEIDDIHGVATANR